jgi:hypothetical protein
LLVAQTQHSLNVAVEDLTEEAASTAVVVAALTAEEDPLAAVAEAPIPVGIEAARAPQLLAQEVDHTAGQADTLPGGVVARHMKVAASLVPQGADPVQLPRRTFTLAHRELIATLDALQVRHLLPLRGRVQHPDRGIPSEALAMAPLAERCLRLLALPMGIGTHSGTPVERPAQLRKHDVRRA